MKLLYLVKIILNLINIYMNILKLLAFRMNRKDNAQWKIITSQFSYNFQGDYFISNY